MSVFKKLNRASFIKKITKRNQGFTMVELMIATAVFSTVLLVTSVGVIGIGRTYYKSLTSSRVHEAARLLMGDVASSLQFSDTKSIDSQMVDPDGTDVVVRCFGSDRFRYFINQPVDATNHGIYRDKRPSQSTCNGCNPAGLDHTGHCIHPGVFKGGQELLGSNMRVLQFDVSGSNPFNIKIRIAYGDNDLLTTYDDNGNLLPPPQDDPTAALCKSNITGTNFCAVSALETTVTSRVE